MRRNWGPKRKMRSRIAAALNEAKRRKRMREPAPDYPPEWPPDTWERRITIEIRTLDDSIEKHTVECYPDTRARYRAVCDGRPWKSLGWHRILRAIAKRFPRIGSRIALPQRIAGS